MAQQTCPQTRRKLKSADSRYAPSGGPLPLVAGEDYQILNASYDSANASEDEKAVSFTIKLTDRNYTFEDGTTQKDFVLNGADVSQTFKINQATVTPNGIMQLSLIHISEPTRLRRISYAVFCLKKKISPSN